MGAISYTIIYFDCPVDSSSRPCTTVLLRVVWELTIMALRAKASKRVSN